MRSATSTELKRSLDVTLRNAALLSCLLVALVGTAPVSAVVVDDFSTTDAQISLADPADSAGDFVRPSKWAQAWWVGNVS